MNTEDTEDVYLVAMSLAWRPGVTSVAQAWQHATSPLRGRERSHFILNREAFAAGFAAGSWASSSTGSR